MEGKEGAAFDDTRGDLLYETPREFPKYKAIAIALQVCILITFLIVNILVFIVLLLCIIIVLAGVAAGGGGTWLPWADTSGMDIFNKFRLVHHRVSIHEFGMTYPRSEIRSILFPETEGAFIHRNEIRAFERPRDSQECIIYLKRKPTDKRSRSPHFS